MRHHNIRHALCEFLDKMLNEEEIKESAIGKRIINGDLFSQLCNAKAITREKRGRGAVWVVAKPSVVQEYRHHHCPDFTPDETKGERYNLIHATRDSKASSRESFRLAFMRSHTPFKLNGETITANEPIGRKLDSIEAHKLCFVENLENFMLNSKLIDDGYVLLFPVGRLGSAVFEKIKADHIMHFGDLDYIGLNEFARVKSFYPNATLYVPDNYFEHAKEIGKTITGGQKATDALLRLCKEDSRVKRVYDFIQHYNLYMEQEGYDD